MNQIDAERVAALTRAVAGKNELVHGVFNYRCQDCRCIELIGLCYGVGGPRPLRDAGVYIPPPYMLKCLLCGGDASHFSMRSDIYFEPVVSFLPMRRFQVPAGGPDPKLYGSSVFCGELVGTPLIVYRAA